EPRHRSCPVTSVAGHPRAEKRIVHQRNPNFVRAHEHDGKMEARGHDADDGEGAFIELDGLTEQIWVGTEAAAPKSFAEDHYGGGTLFVVARQESSAGERLGLHHGKKFRRG